MQAKKQSNPFAIVFIALPVVVVVALIVFGMSDSPSISLSTGNIADAAPEKINVSSVSMDMPSIDEQSLEAIVQVVEPDGTLTLPAADPEGFQHAMERRGISAAGCPAKTKYAEQAVNQGYFMIMSCYDHVRDNPEGAFFSPTAGTIMVIANAPQPVGAIVVIFQANVQGGNLIGFGRPLTVLVKGVNVHRARLSSCASTQFFPLTQVKFQPEYEPPPLGGGTCLKNNNVHSF